jgi:outer membrane protein assembly factor BamE (lipoprotein component of BamABCDE complex)
MRRGCMHPPILIAGGVVTRSVGHPASLPWLRIPVTAGRRAFALLLALVAAPAAAQPVTALAGSASPRGLGVTPEALQAIRPGMSEAEVVATIGRPGVRGVGRDGQPSGAIRWTTPDGKGSLSVGFVDDRAVMATEYGLYPPAQGTPVSRAQADSIQVGMTMERVEQILGSRGEYHGFQQLDLVSHKYIWHALSPGPVILLISFREGRVNGPVHGKNSLR